MGHVRSKARSLDQIEGKSCLHSEYRIFNLSMLKHIRMLV